MPPLILFAIAGAGAFATYKLFEKLMIQARTPDPSETERIRRETAAWRARRQAQGDSRDLGALEWDEATGVYKPRRPGPDA